MLKQTINIYIIIIIKNYDKSIKSSYLEHLDANNQYGRAMLQKLPAGGFKWIKEDDLSKFNENFIKKL